MYPITIVLEATVRHAATVIFLHGLGDTGHAWCSELSHFKPENIKVICPTANPIPVSINGGIRMPAWYDIFGLSPEANQDERGIVRASQFVHRIINEEAQYVPLDKIIVGGFSQGGALSLYSGLTYPGKLGGIVCLSGWLPLHKKFPAAIKCPENVKVLHCHSDDDEIVPLIWGQLTVVRLQTVMTNVSFKTYHGFGHGTGAQVLEDVKIFIDDCVN